MATVKKENDGSYSIRITYTTEFGEYKQKYKKGFKTESKAYAWAENYKDAAIKEDTAKKNIHLKDLIEYVKQIKQSQNLAPRTVKDFTTYTSVLVEELGNMSVDKITTQHLQIVINKYSSTPAKCAHICAYTSSLFRIPYQQGIIQNNPFSRIIKPNKALKTNVKPCSEDNLKTILKTAKENRPQLYPPILLMSACGLRPGEAIAIKESNINKKNWTLTVTNSYSKVDGIEYLKSPKSAAGIREIPITKELYHELIYFKKLNKIESEWICCDLNGNNMSYDSLHCGFKRLEKAYKLPHFFAYQFRHYFGNTNKRNKVDSYTTSVLMGHSSPEITKKHYYSDDKQLNKEATNMIISGILN